MADNIRPKSYQVLITPLVENNVYGDVIDITQDIDISDFIADNAIGKVKREIDNGDYDIGVFTYGNITIKLFNKNGKFNQDDWRSIFPYSRDKAKVNIKFWDGNDNETFSFKGIINEEATRQNFVRSEVRVKVLSQDSVIRTTKVAGGVITTGITFSQAIKNVLNAPEITSVLTYDADEINVGLDLTIDDGSWFDNRTSKDALDALLVVSGSVMLIDETDTMIVRQRDELETTEVFEFFGAGDILGRENIIALKNFNTGLHRTFTSVRFGTQVASDEGLITIYGSRQKSLSYEFITSDIKKLQIAESVLDEFKTPKMEMEIETDTNTAKSIALLALISVDYPYRVKPYKGSEMPFYGYAKYGEDRYPFITGDMKIDPRIAFKVVGIEENPKKFTTILKLRQRGRTLSDFLFSTFIAKYGESFYSESVYTFDETRTDPSRVSVYGAAKYGTVVYGLTE